MNEADLSDENQIYTVLTSPAEIVIVDFSSYKSFLTAVRA